MSSPSSPFRRLDRAIEIYAAWQQSAPRPPAAELLARHPDLRELLEPLLEEAGERREDEPAAFRPGRDLSGTRLADYELLREIGRGAMGVVYEARHLSLGRTVAVKVLPPGADFSARALARFRREAILVARLDHEGVVQVHDVGEQDGLSFYVMERVHGRPLHQVIEAERRRRSESRPELAIPALVAELERGPTESGARQRSRGAAEREIAQADYLHSAARLVLQVASALQHAHEHGVLHRDVKPSNILVQADGRAVLTDFGLARESGLPSLTRTGDFAGTPSYVSPEQARGESGRVDARSDVFSLGVTLYELLTLQRPFRGATSAEVLRGILEEEPPAPRRVDRAIPADLSAIALQALEKSPARRYASAGEMAADLLAFLEHRPVAARPITPWRRFRRWLRREPLRAALAAAGVLVLLLGAYSLESSAREARLREEGARQRDLAERESYLAELVLARSALLVGDALGARRHLEAAPAAWRDWEWFHLSSRVDRSAWSAAYGEARPDALAFDPAGAIVASLWADGGVRVLALADGRELATRAAASSAVQRVAATADAVWLATSDGALVRWDWRAGAEREIARGFASWIELAAVREGAELVGVDAAGALGRWSAEGAELAREAAGSALRRAFIEPAGRSLALVEEDLHLAFWDLERGERRSRVRACRAETPLAPEDRWPAALVEAGAFTPDGQRFASGCRDGYVQLFEVASGRALWSHGGHTKLVRSLAISADGRRLAVGSRDRTCSLWDLEQHSLVEMLRGAAHEVRSVAFHPRGELLATGAWDGGLRFFGAADGRERSALPGHTDGIYQIAFAPGGTRLLTRADDGRLRAFDVEEQLDDLATEHDDLVLAVGFSPRGALLSSSVSERARRSDLRSRAWKDYDALDDVHELAAHPSAERALLGSVRGELALVELADGAVLWKQAAHRGPVTALAFSADGRTAISAGSDYRVCVWDLASGALRRELPLFPSLVTAVALVRDGSRALTATLAGAVQLWDLASGRSASFETGLARDLYALALDPTERWIAVGGEDRVIALLELATGRVVRNLRGSAHRVRALAWLPSGARLVSGGDDRLVRIWDAERGDNVGVLAGHTDWIRSLAVSADGAQIASGAEDGSVRIWSAPGYVRAPSEASAPR